MTPDSILLAEDSPTQSLRLQNTLEKNGFTVTAAPDGRAALGVLATLRPTLVISDIQMPEMDGYELCRHLKADPALRDIPLILLTSLSAPQDIIRGLECGADNFVVKPFEEAILLARIHSVLANRLLSHGQDEAGGIEIEFAGERYRIEAGRRQILNLLLSTYETAVKTNLDLIRAHEDLKSAQAQLIEAEKLQSVGRLAAGVAHEVRNPLAIIDMGAAFLAGQPLDDDGRVILHEMKEAVDRANSVITGLMELSAPREMGMHEEDIHSVIERALAVLADELQRHRIKVETDFAGDLPPVRIDAAKIEQLFVNLITNALDAMPDGGTLTVSTGFQTLGREDAAFEAGERGGARFREGERVIAVEVRDTGTGIPADHLGKIFEPFFTTKPTGRGMGLGLTVARKIVDVHRGKIAVRNQEHGGVAVMLNFKLP